MTETKLTKLQAHKARMFATIVPRLEQCRVTATPPGRPINEPKPRPPGRPINEPKPRPPGRPINEPKPTPPGRPINEPKPTPPIAEPKLPPGKPIRG